MLTRKRLAVNLLWMLSSWNEPNSLHVARVPVHCVTVEDPLPRLAYVYSALKNHELSILISLPTAAPKPLDLKFLPPEKLAVPVPSVKFEVLVCDPPVNTPPTRI